MGMPSMNNVMAKSETHGPVKNYCVTHHQVINKCSWIANQEISMCAKAISPWQVSALQVICAAAIIFGSIDFFAHAALLVSNLGLFVGLHSTEPMAEMLYNVSSHMVQAAHETSCLVGNSLGKGLLCGQVKLLQSLKNMQLDLDLLVSLMIHGHWTRWLKPSKTVTPQNQTPSHISVDCQWIAKWQSNRSADNINSNSLKAFCCSAQVHYRETWA